MKDTDQEQQYQQTQQLPDQEIGNPHYKASQKLEADHYFSTCFLKIQRLHKTPAAYIKIQPC